MAQDNMIQTPDAARQPAKRPDRERILKAARLFLAQKLREALGSLLPAIDEELLARGDVAHECEQRKLYYGAHETLKPNAARLESLAAANWLRLFDQTVRGGDMARAAKQASDPDHLQLVDFGDVDEDLAVKAIAAQLWDGCEDGLFAAGRRLAYLSGRDEGTIAVADILAEAVHAAVAGVAFTVPARIEVLRAIGHHAVRCVAPAIKEVNAYLIKRNVLPKLRRSFVPPKTDRQKSADSPGSADASDIFAMLQRLVSAANASGAGPVAAGQPVAAGGPSASDGKCATTATTAFSMNDVMAALDALQRLTPGAADAAPTTGVLREFRNSDAGQSLGHLDAVTADVVTTLFDFIFDDPAIADPIKALIGRMQIPILKVAMLDKSFFSSKAHPARRLLDGISRAAVRCGPNAGHDDPLYARVAKIVEHLQKKFTRDTSVFDVLCAELNTFLDHQEVAADARAVRAAPLVAAREQSELAALAAEQALACWLAMPLPPAVADILSNEWRALLVRYYLDGDKTSWGAAVATIAELVTSALPQPDARKRAIRVAKLPRLVKRIYDSLNRLQVPDSRRLVLIDSLFSLHAAILRGASPEVTAPPPVPQPAEPEIASEVIEQGGTQLDSVSLREGGVLPESQGASDAADKVANLQRGDWVEFKDGEAVFVRYRLAWISPQRGILLFTNPHSPRALSIAPAALALQISRGDATIVSAAPIFDRAVNRALQSLKADHSRSNSEDCRAVALGAPASCVDSV
jgi:hypothetical protein